MNVLLHNATGNKTAWYADVTDYIYLCNLPASLTRIVPFAGTEHFSVWGGPGEDPDESILGTLQDWGCKIQNVVVDTITSGYEYIASGDFLEDVLYVLSGEWMMGVAEAVGEGLAEIKESIGRAFNHLFEWFKELVVKAFTTLISTISKALHPLIESYSNLLCTTAYYLTGEEVPETASSRGASRSADPENKDSDDYGSVFSAALKFTQILGTVVNVIIAGSLIFHTAIFVYKCHTMGLSKMWETEFRKVFQKVVLGTAVGLFIGNYFEIDRILNRREVLDEYYTISLTDAGICAEVSGTVLSIGEILITFSEKKMKEEEKEHLRNLRTYYLGLTLAFLGFLSSTVPAVTNLSGPVLAFFDMLALTLSVSGLGLMWIGREQKWAEAFKTLSAELFVAELILGIGGAWFALYNCMDHWLEGDWN